MSDRPLPPVPADLDLSGFPWMPLDTAIVMSDLADRASPDAFRASVLLWAMAWKQVPASSLPNDERRLAALIGVSPAKWKGLREWALAGFVLHADGRLYHAMIAEQALAASKRKTRQRDRALSYWRRNGSLELGEQAGDNTLVSDAGGICLNRSGLVLSSPPSPKTGTSSPARATKIPAGWRPSRETLNAMRAEWSLTEADVERYAVYFVDYCGSRDSARYTDFDAAFRNSVRQDWPRYRSARPGAPATAGAGGGSLEERNRRVARRVRQQS